MKFSKYTATISALALAGALSVPDVQAAPVDITTLPGYGVATSGSLNFNGSGGWAGWSAPSGKVVLGAAITSSGDSVSDFAAFRPAGPNESFPHYTFGTDEYGWVLQNNGLGSNNGVQFDLYYADPMAGYTITESADLNYSASVVAARSARSF